MTEIPQDGICCLATSKLKVRLKNYFALGCSRLPFGFCVNRSLRFNNTWPALRQEPLETQPSRKLYTSRVTQRRAYITFTQVRRYEYWPGWDGFLKSLHVLSQGMRPPPSLTLLHSSTVMKPKSLNIPGLCSPALYYSQRHWDGPTVSLGAVRLPG